MRIAHNSLIDTVSDAMERNQTLLAQKQLEIASGQNYTRRSQDTATAAQVSRLEEDQRENDRWTKNIDQGLFWTQASAGKMDNLNEIMLRVSEITTAASNGTHPASYREDLAEELNNALEDILDLANSQIDGVYLFAGTETGQAPFTATRTGDDITAVTYNGNGSDRTIQISETATAEYGVPGGGTDGLFQASSDTVDIFQTLITFRDELRTGALPLDTTIAEVESASSHVVNKVVENGLRQARFNLLDSKALDTEVENLTRISQLKDVDIARAAGELSKLQASYQASLQIATIIDDLNLMKFI